MISELKKETIENEGKLK